MKSAALAVMVYGLAIVGFSQELIVTPPHDCITCRKIIVRDKLAKILNISDCNGDSGMTCRIRFNREAALPSRILVEQRDSQNRVIAKKLLPYPNLKPGEEGRATFPVGRADKLVLVGEWKGPWRSSY